MLRPITFRLHVCPSLRAVTLSMGQLFPVCVSLPTRLCRGLAETAGFEPAIVLSQCIECFH